MKTLRTVIDCPNCKNKLLMIFTKKHSIKTCQICGTEMSFTTDRETHTNMMTRYTLPSKELTAYLNRVEIVDSDESIYSS